MRQIYAQDYLNHLYAIDPESRHVVDKMPDNFLSLWFIAQIFPTAKVIHLKRNPLDNCVACFTTHFLDFYRNPRSVSTASVTQVRKPMYRSSINRWKRYEAHLSDLRDELLPWLEV